MRLIAWTAWRAASPQKGARNLAESYFKIKFNSHESYFDFSVLSLCMFVPFSSSTCMYVCFYLVIYLCVCVSLHLYVYVCVFVCVCVCVCVWERERVAKPIFPIPMDTELKICILLGNEVLYFSSLICVDLTLFFFLVYRSSVSSNLSAFKYCQINALHCSRLGGIGAIQPRFLIENHLSWHLLTFPCLHAEAIHLVINLCTVSS